MAPAAMLLSASLSGGARAAAGGGRRGERLAGPRAVQPLAASRHWWRLASCSSVARDEDVASAAAAGVNRGNGEVSTTPASDAGVLGRRGISARLAAALAAPLLAEESAARAEGEAASPPPVPAPEAGEEGAAPEASVEAAAAAKPARGAANLAFVDISIDGGEPERVVVDLSLGRKEAPAGARRFVELVTGDLSCMKLPVPLIAGSKVEYLDPVSFRSAGPTDTRLKATVNRCEDASANESTRAALEKEHASQTVSHLGSAMVVSIKVKEDPAMADAAAPTGKLVARNGKLEVVPDGPRAALMPLPPAGTAFAVTTSTTTAAAPGAGAPEDRDKLLELDRTHLIVGKIVQGKSDAPASPFPPSLPLSDPVTHSLPSIPDSVHCHYG